MTENTVCWAQFGTRTWSPCLVVHERLVLFLRPDQRPCRETEEEVLVRFFGDGLLAYVDPATLVNFEASFLRHLAKGKEKARVQIAWKAALQYLDRNSKDHELTEDEKLLFESQRKAKELDLKMRNILKELNILSHEKQFGPIVNSDDSVEEQAVQRVDTQGKRKRARKIQELTSDDEHESEEEGAVQSPKRLRGGQKKDNVLVKDSNISSTSSESDDELDYWRRTPRRSARTKRTMEYKDVTSSTAQESKSEPKYSKRILRRSARKKETLHYADEDTSHTARESESNTENSNQTPRRTMHKKERVECKDESTCSTPQESVDEEERSQLTLRRSTRKKQPMSYKDQESSSSAEQRENELVYSERVSKRSIRTKVNVHDEIEEMTPKANESNDVVEPPRYTPRRSRPKRSILEVCGNRVSALGEGRRVSTTPRKTFEEVTPKPDEDKPRLSTARENGEQSTPAEANSEMESGPSKSVPKRNSRAHREPASTRAESESACNDSRRTLRSNNRKMPWLSALSNADSTSAQARSVVENKNVESSRSLRRSGRLKDITVELEIEDEQSKSTSRNGGRFKRKIVFEDSDEEQVLMESGYCEKSPGEKSTPEEVKREESAMGKQVSPVKRPREKDIENQVPPQSTSEFTPCRSSRIDEKQVELSKAEEKEKASTRTEVVNGMNESRSSARISDRAERRRLLDNDIKALHARLETRRQEKELAKQQQASGDSRKKRESSAKIEKTVSERSKRLRSYQGRREEQVEVGNMATPSVSKATTEESERASRYRQWSMRKQRSSDADIATPVSSKRERNEATSVERADSERTVRRSSRISGQNADMMSEQEKSFVGSTRRRISRFVEEENYISESEFERSNNSQSEERRRCARLKRCY